VARNVAAVGVCAVVPVAELLLGEYPDHVLGGAEVLVDAGDRQVVEAAVVGWSWSMAVTVAYARSVASSRTRTLMPTVLLSIVVPSFAGA
jgi:hypothetical protein